MVRFVVQETSDSVGVSVAVFLAFLALLQLALWIAAIVSVLRSQRLTGGGKFLWIVVIVGFPFLGSLGWFIFGRTARLVKADPVQVPGTNVK
ncbi:PLD nuclease N-terminal domain-containing protein [Actinosynnema sp. CS-041913]|uniref:PLD nuclease N-terminal domain-containing protein n=1 Tax=Actinosynnema sp. CS-041913 TaxID=3239917 RepID=UPI003D902137